jgi:hypothetical protein
MGPGGGEIRGGTRIRHGGFGRVEREAAWDPCVGEGRSAGEAVSANEKFGLTHFWCSGSTGE